MFMKEKIRILFDCADPFLGSDGMYHYFYRIRNKINHKEYFGIHSTRDLSDGYSGSGTALKTAKAKYGISCFYIQPLKFFNTKEECAEYECSIVNESYLEANKNRTYNLVGGGNNSRFIPEEVKRKISNSEKGKCVSSETSQKISLSHRGSKPWNKGLFGNNNPQTGAKRHDSTRKNISLGLSKYYETHVGTFLGKHHSNEARQKMSNAKRGKKFSNDHCLHLSESHRGLCHTKESKKHISDTLRNKWISIGCCKRISVYCIELDMKFPSKKAAYRYLIEHKCIHCSYNKFSSMIRLKQMVENMYTFKEI